MRINTGTYGEILWSFIQLSQLLLREMYGDQSGEFVCEYNVA